MSITESGGSVLFWNMKTPIWHLFCLLVTWSPVKHHGSKADRFAKWALQGELSTTEVKKQKCTHCDSDVGSHGVLENRDSAKIHASSVSSTNIPVGEHSAFGLLYFVAQSKDEKGRSFNALLIRVSGALDSQKATACHFHWTALNKF